MASKRIILDVNHAAHVHFVRNLYKILLEKGHEVRVVASDKPLAYKLLDIYQIPYYAIGTYGTSLWSKMYKLAWLDIKMLIFCIKFKPDLITGIVSIRGAHVARLVGARSIVFTDTEHASEQIALFKPFCHLIATPKCFTKDLGKKQYRHDSLHELAYLHPQHFSPDVKVLSKIGLKESSVFFIVRFVAWDATHDINQKGLSDEGKKELIACLEKHGRVLITSESGLPDALKQYAIKVPPTEIHSLMYYSTAYVGEGATMASESSVLGSPSFLINSLVNRNMGYINLLEDQYKLLERFSEERELLQRLEDIEDFTVLKATTQLSQSHLLENLENMCDTQLSLINSQLGL